MMSPNVANDGANGVSVQRRKAGQKTGVRSDLFYECGTFR